MSKMMLGDSVNEDDVLGRRDAFHVPCVVVTSGQFIMPGSNVRFVAGRVDLVENCSSIERQGIADPFAPGQFGPGVKFWVLIQPSLVSDLVHHFAIAGTPDHPGELKKKLDAANARIDEMIEEMGEYTDSDGCSYGCG